MNTNDNGGFDSVKRYHRQFYRVLHDVTREVKWRERYDGSKTTGDLANQAVVQLLERAPEKLEPGQLQGDEAIRKYLYVVLRNMIRDQKDRDRASKRPRRTHAIPLDMVASKCNDEEVESIVQRQECVQELKSLLEQFKRAAVPGLTKEDQQVLAEVFLESISGKTQEEIADQYNVDRTTISRKLTFMARHLQGKINGPRANSF